MLFGKRGLCILCKRYKDSGKIHFIHNDIAVCEECYKKLKTTKDKTFDGKDNIKIVLSPYMYEGSLRNAIKEYKFSGQRLYGNLFGKMLAEELKEHIWLSEYDCIIPVPLHEIRLAERGYNQAEILAKEISDWLMLPLVNDALVRLRNTERQSRLRGAARIENVKGAFGAFGNFVKGKKIILVDDIYTMGETTRACAEALKTEGADDIAVVTLSVKKYEK